MAQELTFNYEDMKQKVKNDLANIINKTTKIEEKIVKTNHSLRMTELSKSLSSREEADKLIIEKEELTIKLADLLSTFSFLNDLHYKLNKIIENTDLIKEYPKAK